MATTINKQRTLSHLVTAPQLAGSIPPEAMPVLEQFIYALCRENSTPEQAQQAFENLRKRFFDWNEVRVSTIRELEEAMAGLSDTECRAQRLVSFLQEVFETTFSFDLEGLQKKGVKQAAKSLSRYGSANDYVGAWVVQRTLGGHAIPVDAATTRCARRMGLIETGAEDTEAIRATLEHLVPKAKGVAFTDSISNLAEQFCWEDEPSCAGCPMLGDCPTGQELCGNGLAASRAARAKPR